MKMGLRLHEANFTLGSSEKKAAVLERVSTQNHLSRTHGRLHCRHVYPS